MGLVVGHSLCKCHHMAAQWFGGGGCSLQCTHLWQSWLSWLLSWCCHHCCRGKGRRLAAWPFCICWPRACEGQCAVVVVQWRAGGLHWLLVLGWWLTIADASLLDHGQWNVDHQGLLHYLVQCFLYQGEERGKERKHCVAFFQVPNYGMVLIGKALAGCLLCSCWVLLQWVLFSFETNQGVVRENERSIRMLAFIFCTKGARYTWCRLNVFQREGLAIVNGNHDGMVVFVWNSYRDPCRLVHHRAGTARNYLLSKL